MTAGKRILETGILILFGILFIAQTTGPNGTKQLTPPANERLPPELLRPRYGEDPCFPHDYVIGRLGRCDATEESYRLAQFVAASLAAGTGKTDGVIFPEQKRLSALEGIAGFGTRRLRVGGGRNEPDGSVSFLIRFLGREKSITGELYLRWEEPKAVRAMDIMASTAGFDEDLAMKITPAENTEPKERAAGWYVDDIFLESPRGLTEGKFGPNAADMTPYERFF